MTDRLACCVPGCKRTCRGDKGWTEFLCSNHWPIVSPSKRKRKAKLFRMYKRRFGDNHFSKYKGGSPERLQAVKLDRLCDKAWKACTRQAIERAMGI